jgi:hypothetical protein
MALTASAIQRIQLKAEEMWADSRKAAEYTTHADAARAVLSNQTARFRELEDSTKDNTVRVVFVDPCGVAVEDCEASCDLTGAQPSTDYKDYALDICKESNFSVSENIARTNMYSVEDLTANRLNLAKKALDEYWAAQVLVKLKAFAGINVFNAANGGPTGYTYAAGTTTVPAADYSVALLGYLTRAAILNQMDANYIIDNGELWASVFNAGIAAGNLDGKGLAAMAAELQSKLTFDMWNFAKAGITEDTFIIGTGAVAMKTIARHSSTPEYIDGKVNQWRFSTPSNVLPGVVYDVFSQLTCATTGTGSATQEDIVHNFKVKTRGGIFLNPEGCPVTIGATTYTPSGVISLTKGS